MLSEYERKLFCMFTDERLKKKYGMSFSEFEKESGEGKGFHGKLKRCNGVGTRQKVSVLQKINKIKKQMVKVKNIVLTTNRGYDYIMKSLDYLKQLRLI